MDVSIGNQKPDRSVPGCIGRAALIAVLAVTSDSPFSRAQTCSRPETDAEADGVPSVTVRLPDGTYSVEWFDPPAGTWRRAGDVPGNERALAAPGPGDGLLLLRSKGRPNSRGQRHPEGAQAFDAEVTPETAKNYIPPDKSAFVPPVRQVGSHDVRIDGSGDPRADVSQDAKAIAWGRDSLWVHHLGRIRKLKRRNGSVGKESLLDVTEINSFAFDGDAVWTVNGIGVKKLSGKDGKGVREFRFEREMEMPAGLALVGGTLYVADRKANKIFGISPENGEKTSEVPAPSRDITGLAAFGEYILVADGNDKAVYLITEDGYVILRVELDAAPLGTASDGKLFWTIDAQGKLGEFMIDRSRRIHLSKKRTATIVYQASHGPEGYIAVPWNMNRQKILGKVQIAPPSPVEKDDWGQPSVKSRKLGVTAEIYDVQYYIWPDRVGCTNDIPEDIISQYLVDGELLKLDDPGIQKARRWITSDGTEKDCYRLVQRAYQYATEHAHYEKRGGWLSAPELLKKGAGTCSPLSFLFVSLCRASGIPARFQAGTRYRDRDPSVDTEFHRWSEVYLPGYGWVPVDSSGVGKDPTPAQRARYFGHVPNTDLIMTLGGGGSNFFEWGYNATRGGTASWSGIRVEQ